MIRRPPRSTQSRSSAASDVYKRQIKPALALGGWVAFKPAQGGVMAMGDLVLLEAEINPVMAKMLANGLEITAVHNHLLRASPATFYMPVAGHGAPVKVATAIRDALAE